MPARSSDHQAVAARNNALWCHAVARANRQPNAFHPDFWVNDGSCLPLYPSVVTLSAEASPDLMARIFALPRGAAVKDSFANLDLEPLGFRPILTGTWLHRPAGAVSDGGDLAVTETVDRPADLEAWIDAWAGDEPQGRSNFGPELLSDPDIQFDGLRTDTTIVGGAVFNAGPEGVVGLSNLFGTAASEPAILAALIAGHTTRAIVGYEVEDSIVSTYQRVGFCEIGTLRIWLRL